VYRIGGTYRLLDDDSTNVKNTKTTVNNEVNGSDKTNPNSSSAIKKL